MVKMVLCWVASAFLAAEQSFRRIQSYRHLWMVEARLESDISLEAKPNVADPRRGKTRQSVPNVGARRLGQDEQYLTVREILFRARSSRHGRDYHASLAILAGVGLQR